MQFSPLYRGDIFQTKKNGMQEKTAKKWDFVVVTIRNGRSLAWRGELAPLYSNKQKETVEYEHTNILSF